LDERYWRAKADEIRRMAQAVVDPLVKNELRDIACGYERIAKLIKAHQAKTAK
jgi:ribosomal protein L16 Arg81 hydroxylase